MTEAELIQSVRFIQVDYKEEIQFIPDSRVQHWGDFKDNSLIIKKIRNQSRFRSSLKNSSE